MKRTAYLFFAVCLVAVLAVAPGAGARPLAEPTPTHDIRTPPPTPTAGGGGLVLPTSALLESGCPAGLPAGYGTVTPDALWLLTCGACVPTATPWSTEFPTAIASAVSTPVCTTPDVGGVSFCFTPSPSPSPSPTPIASPSPTPGLYASLTCGLDSAVPCTQIDDHTISYGDGGVANVVGIGGAGSGYMTYTLASNSNIYVSMNVGADEVWVAADGGTYTKFTTDYDRLVKDLVQGVDVEAVSCGGNCYRIVVIPGLHEFSFSQVAGNNNLQYFGSDWWSIWHSVWFHPSSLILSSGPITGTPTPSPTPGGTTTPTPGVGFCSSINGGTGGLENQELVFWGPPGEPVCTVIPSFSTTEILDILGWVGFFSSVFSIAIPGPINYLLQLAVGFFSVTTPAATVCAVTYEILEVDFFGLTVSLALFASIFIGGYIINHFVNR